MKKKEQGTLVKNFKKFATHRFERPKNAGKILKGILIGIVAIAVILRFAANG